MRTAGRWPSSWPTNSPNAASGPAVALLLNGRFNSMEYASYAPNAPQVYIDDTRFRSLWPNPERRYLLAREAEWPRFEGLVGRDLLSVVAVSGGKFLATNHPLESTPSTQPVASLPSGLYLTQSHGRVQSKGSASSPLTLSATVSTGLVGLGDGRSAPIDPARY